MPTNPVFTPVDTNGLPLKATSNGDGTSSLVAGSAGPATFLTYLSAAQAVSNTGTSFSTTAVAGLAVDVTLSSFTGGAAPAVTFFVERLGADGVWYRIWTSAALTTAGATSVQIGPFPAATGIVTAVLTGTARFGWSSTGAPTAITFSASVIGR
ncbi:hypothetical protein QMK19_03650 [Streptomyces sp. H10-C2]|uniref:hypothetical protein n=1 Tax=unclassified Streptomyces TaxID=2593676 RepID=UPI0024B9C4D9|nr:MULTISPECIES: hypothetical protein [unclassified Streptomyces]MDJ0342282.1 hypothetical protein [Streptomyces sp. PH10-H1]MDJ0368796.1 hypothetical protein [Streptomyces sp. H10-C2]